MADTRDERSARLEARLQDGYTKIGKAMAAGVDVDNWEAAWVDILREYETLNDEIEAHHAEVRQAEFAGMPRAEQEVTR